MDVQSTKRKRIALLGSTGSIGTQTLQVIAAHPDHYEAYALTAGGNVELLIEQARTFVPEIVVIAEEVHYARLTDALQDLPIKVYAGVEALAQIVEDAAIDMVVAALVGYAGLKPTINAIRAGKQIALANKETLVVAGELITELALKHGVPIIPVDSEHSAIFQCLVGEGDNEVEKLMITASGGPFRTYSMEQLATVTKEQALRHPNWDMGAKVTIDSASMMNKGLEMIEAKWLFGLLPERIEAIVHPQSIVHSLVQFTDGSVKAQLGVPDMRLPIAYALSYPDRLPAQFGRIDLLQLGTLTFEQPDTTRFRNLALAIEAMKQGGTTPCVMNAANEVAVSAFLQGRVSFLRMSDLIEQTIERTPFINKPTYDDYVACHTEACLIAASIIN